MESDAIGVVRRWFEEFNHGDFEAALAHLDVDVRYEGPADPEIWWAKGKLNGRAAIGKEMLADIGEHFDNLDVEIDEIWEAGPAVVLVARHTGTTKKGSEFRSPLVQIYTVSEGRIVAIDDYPKMVSWLEAVRE